jgi:hypothetical protein
MSAKKKSDKAAGGGSPGMTCSAWIPASNPPERFTRVIAKNEYDHIEDCYYITAPSPGFYSTVPGGLMPWPHATHYIPWPNKEL